MKQCIHVLYMVQSHHTLNQARRSSALGFVLSLVPYLNISSCIDPSSYHHLPIWQLTHVIEQHLILLTFDTIRSTVLAREVATQAGPGGRGEGGGSRVLLVSGGGAAVDNVAVEC